ncbi:hypothetical protein TOPH_07741 [Tolypocladium ophioglossoides CBS 100239]|uniref:Uncharacterized protein n=1 Tax=Tolypocladium ophioglossoides (strain CBS 100239) TaxID=1163406 RepID=A0A0L0N1F9_TOLOC|nr:hypothetical protein TOPH_07741 [Tolypocladium ophioglossoides CBS 100239]
MPFPLLWPDGKIKNTLDIPQSRRTLGHDNPSEARLQGCWRAASRIYACFTELQGSPKQNEDQVHEMVRLAFGFDTEGTDQYLKNMECN